MLGLEIVIQIIVCFFTLYCLYTKHYDISFNFMSDFRKECYFFSALSFLFLAGLSHTRTVFMLSNFKTEISIGGILAFIWFMYLSLDTNVEVKYWAQPLIAATIVLIGLATAVIWLTIDNFNILGNGYTFKEKRAVLSYIATCGNGRRKLPKASWDEYYMNIFDVLSLDISESDLKLK